MPCIKIKQLDERIATSGVHFGGSPERRKLEPGEIVEIPEDMLTGSMSFIPELIEADKIELTLGEPTRPLDYASYREAQLCSPSFVAHGPDDEKESEKAREVVAARLAGSAPKPQKAETPATPATKKAVNSRAARRAKTKANATNGQKATA